MSVNNKFCLGLTGGIACGKSTIVQYFLENNYYVLNADLIAKQLTAKYQPAWQKILDKFGTQVLLDNQELNRKKLRELIFNNQENRIWIENLLHPEIRNNIYNTILNTDADKFLIEIPLLTNRNDYPYLDKVILLKAPLETQIKRLIARDKCSYEQAKSIIHQQPSAAIYESVADYILINDSTIQNLIETLNKLDLSTTFIF